jgi:hypothetical protein
VGQRIRTACVPFAIINVKSAVIEAFGESQGLDASGGNSLGVSANDQKNGKHHRGFGDIQPPGSSREIGNYIRSCHEPSLFLMS